MGPDPNLRPVIVRKHAFGNQRKMIVSPQHGILATLGPQEVLVRAKLAAEVWGGKWARIDKSLAPVTYVHIMFEHHELVIAEGAPTESYYPGPTAISGLSRLARSQLLFAFPKLAAVSARVCTVEEAYGPPARKYAKRSELRASYVELIA
ncbi:Hint domain-containing protein [Loktanella sp. Alg231-35]|uniref:Hint domain-containing protein n=1 Tax=Loktanella sp. Alg231-35 TaxID=1922220 RepID=UPI000D55DBC7|nr:Hint domain-containing protein [Loktanella sp. Alg231-35]